MTEKLTYEEQVMEASQMAAAIVKLPSVARERIRYMIDGAALVCRMEDEDVTEEAG